MSHELPILTAPPYAPQMHPDDVILVSVDDHIAEPADMFVAHVPSKYRYLAPRVVTDADGFQQWW